MFNNFKYLSYTLVGAWGMAVGVGLLLLGAYEGRPGDAGQSRGPLARSERCPPRGHPAECRPLAPPALPLLAGEPRRTGPDHGPMPGPGDGARARLPTDDGPRGMGPVGPLARGRRHPGCPRVRRSGWHRGDSVRRGDVRPVAPLRSYRPAGLPRRDHRRGGTRATTPGMRPWSPCWSGGGPSGRGPPSSAVPCSARALRSAGRGRHGTGNLGT